MSGQGGQFLTETDPEDGGDAPLIPASTSLPEGIANSREPPSTQLRDDRTPPADEPFNIIETDDNFVPLGPQQPSEPRLNEIDAGPRSLVERQAAEREAEQRGQRRAPRTPAERRQAAREGRDRTLQENQQLRRQIEELRSWRETVEPHLANLEPRLQEIDQARVADQVAQLDRGIAEQQGRATEARRRLSEAVIAQDGDAINAALELRDDAIMQQQRLSVQRNMLATGDPLGRTDQGQRQQQPDPRSAPQRQQQPAPPRPLSPRAQALANDFASQHDWMGTRDPADENWAFDRDTALRLDAEVTRQGYDPAGLEYWDELENRMRRYLPHRFADAQPARRNGNGNGNGDGATQRSTLPPPERRGPMVPGGGDRAPGAPGRNDVLLSPARKAAMMDAGIIGRDGRTVEDKAKFRRMLKQYRDYDRANGTVRQ